MKLERDILESLAEGVVAVDEAGLIVSANGAARTLLGLGPLPLGVSFFETVRQRELQELTRTVLATGCTSRPFAVASRNFRHCANTSGFEQMRVIFSQGSIASSWWWIVTSTSAQMRADDSRNASSVSITPPWSEFSTGTRPSSIWHRTTS